MRRSFGVLVVALCAACASGTGNRGGPPPASWVVGSYQPGTHSHNDYDRRRPLAEALAHGFASIEVDVALRGGTLYVTHDTSRIDTSATLVGMYLEPLDVLQRRNGGGIYPDPAPPLQLLVDVKSDADAAYRALDTLLMGYPDLVTRWTADGVTPGAVEIVLSGNRATDRIRTAADRRIALDGRIWEDRAGFPESAMPLVSVDWNQLEGGDRAAAARGLIEQVHAEGRRIRFWGTADRPEVWARLRALQVDYIGTDDIGGLYEFMRGSRGR